MKSELNKAVSMKDSGIERLSEVPEYWEARRLKDILTYTKGYAFKSEDFVDSGTPVVKATDIKQYRILEPTSFINSSTIESYKKVLLKKNDIVIATVGSQPNIVDSAVGQLARIDKKTAGSLLNQNTLIIRIKTKGISNKFIYYILISEFFRQHLNLIARGTANQSSIKVSETLEYLLFLPPFDEQEAIAHYLDTKTDQIDRKIDLLTQKAALYGNLKQSLINETVTRGLDKSVPMKDSEIKWLGDVPEHWDIKRLKDVIENLESGVSVNAENLPAQIDEYGILKTSCVNKYGFNPNENKTILPEEISRAKCSPRQGSIIISRMNTPELVGASGFVDKDYPKLFLPDRLWQTVFHRNPRINSKWLSYLLSVTRLKEVISFSATGSSPSMKNLAQEDFLCIKIFTPPLSEQKAIADYLDTKTAQIDQIIQTINTQIEKLKELRKTLINDVVTGQIKVV
ncbi:restriction endonuclease subunit S [Microcoleus sp. AT9_B5]